MTLTSYKRGLSTGATPLNAPRVGTATSKLGETPSPCDVCLCFSTARLQQRYRATVGNLTSRTGDQKPSPLRARRTSTPLRLGGVARAEAPPGHLHWLRLSGGGVSAQGSETAQLRVNAGPRGGEAQVGEEQESVPGKPCLGAMEGEVRLPPGESCREGERLPRAQGPGVWLAMRPGGRPRVVAETGKIYTNS